MVVMARRWRKRNQLCEVGTCNSGSWGLCEDVGCEMREKDDLNELQRRGVFSIEGGRN